MYVMECTSLGTIALRRGRAIVRGPVVRLDIAGILANRGERCRL